MRWYLYVAYFFGGAFLANSLRISAMAFRGTPSKAPSHHRPG